MLAKLHPRCPKNLGRLAASFGSAGPYNPYRYKSYFLPRQHPQDQELYDMVKKIEKMPTPPIRNMRHVNPVRESGPLPPYEGPYTMEDIRKIYLNTSIGLDRHAVSTDIDEIMRRVPGITRKEAEQITTLGLTPDEEVDFAYLTYNLGIDVFYPPNQMYVIRQVVTNSKGEKVEVYWNSQVHEDLSYLHVGFAPVYEYVDYHWEVFLWGDPPIHPLVDFDLCAPGTWFEYECEWGGEMNMLEDQVNLPEDLRQFPSPRNPNSRSELWISQEKSAEIKEMEDPNWYPQGTTMNIYKQPTYRPPVTEN